MPQDMRYPHEDAHTRLINISNSPHDEMDVYIGGEVDTEGISKSVFANPFDKNELGREEAVVHYKMYLYRRYLEDKKFRKALHGIEGKTLGCWCYPERCHGEVIVDLLNKHHKVGTKETVTYMEKEMEDIDTENLGVEGFKEYESTMNSIQKIKEEISED